MIVILFTYNFSDSSEISLILPLLNQKYIKRNNNNGEINFITIQVYKTMIIEKIILFAN